MDRISGRKKELKEFNNVPWSPPLLRGRANFLGGELFNVVNNVPLLRSLLRFRGVIETRGKEIKLGSKSNFVNMTISGK